MNPLIEIALAEAAGGAAAGLVADSVLYGVDSAKIRAQSKPLAGRSTSVVSSLRILFRGFVPSILLGSIPVFGTFFFLYAPAREMLSSSSQHYQIVLLPMASICAAVPATIIGIPSDVIKKRLVLGVDKNFSATIRHIKAESGGWRGFFAGWHVNLIRDLPFAAVKIGLYETLVSYYKSCYGLSKGDPISSQGAAFCGIVSGIGCAILTAPLDIVNTKIKSRQTLSTSIINVGRDIVLKEGVSGLFRGVAMRSIVLGLGSFIFWPIQQSVSQYCRPMHNNRDNDLIS